MKKTRIIYPLLKIIFIFSISSLFTGCFSFGDKFSSDLTWVENNKTNQEDVKMVLGTPYSLGNSGGVSTWTYAFYQYIFPAKTAYKELRFYWSQNKTVKHYNFNSSFPEDLSRVHVGGRTQTHLSQKQLQKNNTYYKN